MQNKGGQMPLDVSKNKEVKAVLRKAQEKQKKSTEELIYLLNQDSLDVKEILELSSLERIPMRKIKTTRLHYI
jgi:hypothetical protein